MVSSNTPTMMLKIGWLLHFIDNKQTTNRRKQIIVFQHSLLLYNIQCTFPIFHKISKFKWTKTYIFSFLFMFENKTVKDL